MNGYILVGGQSRRMGSDKALLNIYGQNLCHFIMEKLKKAGCNHVFLVGKKHLPIAIPQIPESWTAHLHFLVGEYMGILHLLSPRDCFAETD